MPTERKLAAIMFTDIVGYTALMATHRGRVVDFTASVYSLG